jgi:hypothetical protein
VAFTTSDRHPLTDRPLSAARPNSTGCRRRLRP